MNREVFPPHTGEVIQLLQSGIYIRDLDEQQTAVMYSALSTEADNNSMSGPMTEAYINSIHGLVMHSVLTGRRRTRTEAVYTPDDAAQDFYANVGMPWHISLQHNSHQVSTMIYPRAYKQLRNGRNSFYIPSVATPRPLVSGQVIEYLREIEVLYGPLQPVDFEHAIERSGSSPTYKTSPKRGAIAASLWLLSNAEPVVIESITNDDAWEQRCLIDADVDDDEFVGESNELIDEHWQKAENYDEEKKSRAHIDSLLTRLTGREKDVIQMRYGLTGKDPMKLQEIGDVLDITRERVRQIEVKALLAMRHPIIETHRGLEQLENFPSAMLPRYFAQNFNATVVPSFHTLTGLYHKRQFVPFSRILNDFGSLDTFIERVMQERALIKAEPGQPKKSHKKKR